MAAAAINGNLQFHRCAHASYRGKFAQVLFYIRLRAIASVFSPFFMFSLIFLLI